MFGHHARRREQKRQKESRLKLKESKKRFEAQNPERLRQEDIYNKQKMEENVSSAGTEREKARSKGREYAAEVMGRKVEGLDPNQRKAMQYEANRGIQRGTETANRELLGNQAKRGIVGKGGVGYAQQRELQKLASEARGGVHRDLDKLNADMMEKRRAQEFGIESGEAAQHQLDRQIAQDEINLEKERKRQREFEDRFYQQFSRV